MINFRLLLFSRNLPNYVSQAREIEFFCKKNCKLVDPLDFFRGFGPRIEKSISV